MERRGRWYALHFFLFWYNYIIIEIYKNLKYLEAILSIDDKRSLAVLYDKYLGFLYRRLWQINYCLFFYSLGTYIIYNKIFKNLKDIRTIAFQLANNQILF